MINFGVIGAGNIAKKFCEAVNGIGGNLHAVASRSFEKAQNYKSDYGFQKAYGNYDALLEDKAVDCVYIATPHALHYDHMMRALDHGKHILCEKSFTLNAARAEEVFKKAREKRLFVMEAMWTRFLPVPSQVVRHVRDGHLGKVDRVDASFTFNVPVDPSRRTFDKSVGGGALLDIGIYPITFVNMLLGPPDAFDTTVDKHESGIDLSHTLTYHYGDAVAHMRASFQDSSTPKATIHGSRGTIEMPYFWQAESADVYDLKGHHVETISKPFKVNGFEYEIEEVERCIEEGRLESDTVPHSVTLEILRQMDAIRKRWGLVYPQEQ